MFAVDHAATALILKRRFPAVPLVPLLVSVQAMELAWVVLNYAGIERTLVEPCVESVADIHLAYMPFSHSVATAIATALLVWWIGGRIWKRAAIGAALAIGLLSHLLLDLMTHARDIALAPGSGVMLGTGLYDRAPVIAFILEMAYGVLCWWVYVRARKERTRWRGLLAYVVIGNLLNLSFLSPGVPGPEAILGGRPLLMVTMVSVQIVVTLWLVYALAARDLPEKSDESTTTGA